MNPHQHKKLTITLDTVYGASTIGATLGACCLETLEGVAALSACSLIAMGSVIGKHFVQIDLEPPPPEIEALNRALEVLHSIVLQAKKKKGTTEPNLRLCVYVRTKGSPELLRRVTRQIGDDETAFEPEEFSVKTGIVGRVALTGKPHSVSLNSDVNLVDFLKEWSFEPHEAEQIRKDRRAWCGVPLGAAHDSRCVGVLFADSDDAGFFGNQSSSRQKLLRQGAVPIARTLRDVYTLIVR